MISSISWVPRGVATKHPKKYEVSTTEQELISKIIEQQEQEVENGDSDDNNNNNKDDDEDNEQTMIIDNESNDNKDKKKLKKTKTVVDTSGLPPELRMDEYSDDDDDDDDCEDGDMNENKLIAQMKLAKLLIGTDDDNNQNDNDNDDNNSNNADGDVKDFVVGDGSDNDKDDDDDDNDNIDDNKSYDTDDDLEDVPDTREYVPTNIDGLQAMNIGGGNANAYRHSKKKNNSDENDDDIDDFDDNDRMDDNDDDFDDDDDDDESFIEDTQINDTDAIILVAKTEEDFPSLEVHVYDTIDGNLYVHHDITLPAFPLCVEHIGCQVPGGNNGSNFCAIGTFQPGIEIWNLDVLNPLEPTCTLGGTTASNVTDELLQYQLLNQNKSNSNNNNKKKNNNNKQPTRNFQAPTLRPGSHTDAVLSLSWNVNNVLASGSADCTVKIWDISSNGSEPVATYKHHTDKVQSVQFNPVDTTLIATGSYDRTVSLVDARSPSTSSSKNNSNSNNNTKSVRITSDCEGLVWDPYHNELLTVLADDGRISCWDVRQFTTKTPLWTFVPSSNKNGGISDIAYNAHVPGLLATCSTVSKTVSLWDTYSTTTISSSTQQSKIKYTPIIPQLITSKDMCAGKLFAVSFYPSIPWLLGTGGSGNILSLWDLSSSDDSVESSLVHKRFTSRMSINNNQDTSSAVTTTPTETSAEEPLVWSSSKINENTDDNNVDDDGTKPNTNNTGSSKKNTKKKKSKKKVVHKSGL